MIVISKRVGRLANRMLLFAHFMGAALEHGFVVLNPAFGPFHSRYFPTTARDLLCRFPPGRGAPPFPFGREVLYAATRSLGEGLHHLQRLGLDVGLVRLRRDQHVDLNSDAFLDVVRRHRVVLVHDWFFRNAGNVARHRGRIRAYFTPWEHHLGRARTAVEPARRRDRLAVGVHVRQDDYRRFKGGRFFFRHDQYRRVMASVEAAFPERDISFLVCSDAPVPPGAFPGLDVLPGPRHELEDLYALAHCDLIVGPPSTYSRWASYWGDAPLYVVTDPDEPVSTEAFHVATNLDWDRDPAGWASAAPPADGVELVSE